MEVKVKDRQSLADMAIQTAGSMEAAFRLASANDVSLTDTLQDGQVLDAVEVESTETVRRYSAQNIEPATALSEEELSALAQEGINFMGIEIDFIVS
jgi:hypothetical protein